MYFRQHEQPGPQFILTSCTDTGRLCRQNFYTGFLQNLEDRKKCHEAPQTSFYRNTNPKARVGEHLSSCTCLTLHCALMPQLCHLSSSLQTSHTSVLGLHCNLPLRREATDADAPPCLSTGLSLPMEQVTMQTRICNNSGTL